MHLYYLVRMGDHATVDRIRWGWPQTYQRHRRGSGGIQTTFDRCREFLIPFCDTTWRTIVALGRFGGLRTPSETLSLRWTDIDREKGRVCVQSPKTEHHLNGANRAMPLFPELRKYLEEAKAKAPCDAVCVVDERYRKPAMTANGWATPPTLR